MKKSFLNSEKPLLTTMVMSKDPNRAIEIVDIINGIGTDAFGIQIDQFPLEYHNETTYRKIFEAMGELPIYATNYRKKPIVQCDEDLASDMLLIAKCGATLCDVQGDLFEPHPEQVCMSESAVSKQMRHIENLKNAGVDVLMSSHLTKFAPEEEILRIAHEHIRRGADIVKIVSKADNEDELYENIRINGVLKKELKIPFLFLSGGSHAYLHRRIGFALGSCMCLCSCKDDEFGVKLQPELAKMKAIIENYG